MYKGPEVVQEWQGSRSLGQSEWGREWEEPELEEPGSMDSGFTSEGSRGPLQGFRQSSGMT